MIKNYYDVLGVDKKANQSEIKKAFRKKAHKYHPDKDGGDEKKFKEANEAYTILSDEKKKQQYDTYGSSDAGGSSGGGFQGGGFDFSGFQGSGGGFDFDFGDIFGGFQGRGSRQKRGDDLVVNLKITFEESVFGVNKTFGIKKDIICSDCSGTGAKDKKIKKCNICGGEGKVYATKQTIFGATRVVEECGNCMGTGDVPEVKCKKCDGERVIRKSEDIDIKIPAGVENGSRLRVKEKGGVLIGGVNGDLYIDVEVEDNKKFVKDGYDIKTKVKINLTDAVLGTIKEIDVVDGKLKIKIPSGINSGDILKVKDQGFVVSDNRRGIMYLTIDVVVPKKIGKKEKKLFEELKGLGF